MAREKIDWAKGEKLWRLGQLTASEIGRQLGCPASTIIRHMESKDVKQDQSAEVQRRTKAALAIAETQRKRNENSAKRKEEKQTIAEVTEEDICDAVDTNVALVMSHRNDLTRLARIEQNLFEELDGEPKKLYITQYQGQIVKQEVGLTVTEKASTLSSLTGVMAKRIEKQRQAFGITDGAENHEDPLTQLLDSIAARRVCLVKE